MPDVLALAVLARLAEVEKDANESHSLGCASTDPCYEPPYEDGPDYSLCDCRQRDVLRLCRAHRQIVDACQGELSGDNGPAAYTLAEWTLRQLAVGLGVVEEDRT